MDAVTEQLGAIVSDRRLPAATDAATRRIEESLEKPASALLVRGEFTLGFAAAVASMLPFVGAMSFRDMIAACVEATFGVGRLHQCAALTTSAVLSVIFIVCMLLALATVIRLKLMYVNRLHDLL